MAQGFDGGRRRDYSESVSRPRRQTRLSRATKRIADFFDRNMSTLAGIAVASVAVTVLCGIVGFSMMILPDRTGVQKVIVPDMVGKTYRAGELDENIFRVIIEYEYHGELPVGVVVEQYPPANLERKVVRGEHPCTLTLTVSRGKNTVMLPQLSGVDARDARERLSALGIECVVVYVPDSQGAAGTVISTDPAAYTDVPVGGSVTIKVSGAEPGQVIMPALVGLSETEARARLAELGLETGSSEYISSDKPAGTVLEQSSPFGAQMPRSATVYLTVSKG